MNRTVQVTITDAALTTTKKSGTEQVALYGQTVDGEKLTAYLFLTEKTQERTIKTLLGLGWDGEDYEGFRGLKGKPAEFECEDEEYEGKTRERVKWVNVPGASMAKPLDKGARLSVQERLRGVVLAAKQATTNGATLPLPEVKL